MSVQSFRYFVATYAKLAVILNSLFVVFLNIIGEVVDGDVVVLDILHDLFKYDMRVKTIAKIMA